MHSCPHCGAAVQSAGLWKATLSRTFVCITCHGKSWFREPFGLGILGLLVMFTANYFASLYLPSSHVWLVYAVTAVLLLCTYFFFIRRFGVLRPIAGTARVAPNYSPSGPPGLAVR